MRTPCSDPYRVEKLADSLPLHKLGNLFKHLATSSFLKLAGRSLCVVVVFKGGGGKEKSDWFGLQRSEDLHCLRGTFQLQPSQRWHCPVALAPLKLPAGETGFSEFNGPLFFSPSRGGSARKLRKVSF